MAGRSGSVCGRRADGARKGHGTVTPARACVASLRRRPEAKSIVGDLSAATLGPDGALWVASDELSGGRITLSGCRRKRRMCSPVTSNLRSRTYIDLFEGEQDKAEADIEGLDYARRLSLVHRLALQQARKAEGREPARRSGAPGAGGDRSQPLSARPHPAGRWPAGDFRAASNAKAERR